MKSYTELTRCLACDGSHLHPYLDLGSHPLANSFHDGTKDLPRFPLVLNVCKSCFHSQLSVAVDPDLMFRDYAYVSGTTRTLRRYFADFVDRVENDFAVNLELKVLEIGSNDGTLLKEFAERGHMVFGVDPARNIDRNEASHAGVQTLCEFWSARVVDHMLGKGDLPLLSEEETAPFDVIIAMNVLGHVADPFVFLSLCKKVLAPGGRIYVQTSQAKMLLNCEFDTVYHEHVSYFTVSSFMSLAPRCGLVVERIEYVPVHGTSYLVEMVADHGQKLPETSSLYNSERMLGYYAMPIYERFAGMAVHVKKLVEQAIEGARKAGYRIAGYGAAAKGMTFLNYTGVDLDFIVDDNSLKQGKLTPGKGIRVVGPDAMEEGGKTLWVILSWNFYDEIVDRIKGSRPTQKDMFLTYFPRMRLS